MRETVKHPLLLQLYDYWHKLRGARRFPLRREFEPVALPRLLPYLIVNDVEVGPRGKPRFRVRLEGDQVVRARGGSAKGKYLDEAGVIVFGNDVTSAYARLVETGEPWYSEGTFASDQIRSGMLYRLALPFGGESDARVDYIIVGFVHDAGPAPKT
jgi:hypothetical protein